MTQASYSYDRTDSDRYVFTSIGEKHIEKAVIFQQTRDKNIINIAFGDLKKDGSIDDKVSSNNGDIIRVLVTVIEILKDFTQKHPNKEILLAGSTPGRTRLYTRILKTYYHEFSKDFRISALIEADNRLERIPFDPCLHIEYFAFLIKRF